MSLEMDGRRGNKGAQGSQLARIEFIISWSLVESDDRSNKSSFS